MMAFQNTMFINVQYMYTSIEFCGENFRGLPIWTVGWALLCGKFADKPFPEGGNTAKFTKSSPTKVPGYTVCTCKENSEQHICNGGTKVQNPRRVYTMYSVVHVNRIRIRRIFC